MKDRGPASKSRRLDAGALRRLLDAWRENEASRLELRRRFRLSEVELSEYVSGIRRESSVCSRRSAS